MFGGRDGPSDEPDQETARERLVERLQRRRDLEERTADAMRAVPRHAFVPPGRREDAYADRPLPIGEGQTISAPHMVAVMVDLLDLDGGERVLEIGTGCGYHAAVTAEAVGAGNLYTVEYHESLAESAREQLAQLGYGAVDVRAGDGHEGWPEHAPYDAAYLTCAADDFPAAVVDQVRTGGRLLAPLGTRPQRLVRGRKREDGDLDRGTHGRVRFVPMRGG
jgi:protein-L-isoaspartate(D-aspartate) O-methyltransferase